MLLSIKTCTNTSFLLYFLFKNSKLDLFYDDIHKEFASVCWKMRQGNLMVFVKDMTYHLTDLQYTKGKGGQLQL